MLQLHALTFAATAAALCALTGPAFAQGALKPVEALIVNPESRPVPVADKAVLDAAKAILEATRAAGRSAGQAPYQQSVGSLTCEFVGTCIATFAAVPAGKRLVLTHVSGAFAVPVGASAIVVLTSSAPLSSRLVLPLPQNFGSSTLITSSPVTYYVEAGRTPHVELNGVNSAGNSTVTLVGHLLDAP